ncbi:NifB/NifX family molybdenum-iron cluster-binding protein [Alkalilimnicola ehrlichii MLHE-1]|uniref:Dinitrogenase iron-molybdenum cofactor biosynthesis domain-containing protein n=1 Tax=Alkalilimnicola ehrlichii (strain ATCC BAA-1101 / DSM 17681 / MLHE-1) TaxID=187272 RepID=Q0AA19_ALKEH|nr:NifB/NifX family molybdenum-iron cluster-binding protein [Alkalilimnicola ehrlichii]ABI56318.1 conserved hypothetical protein [Alkalilimnicola ehrlichii MLHE-1]
MKTAIPVNTQGRVSGHFAKAPYMLVLTDEGQRQWVANPMDADRCSGRCKLLAELEQAGVTRVLVRQIGQRTLGRFLRAGLQVYRLPAGATALPRAAAIPAEAQALSQASQGRPSKPRASHGEGTAGMTGCCGHH